MQRRAGNAGRERPHAGIRRVVEGIGQGACMEMTDSCRKKVGAFEKQAAACRGGLEMQEENGRMQG
jgi:hypothetical protein